MVPICIRGPPCRPWGATGACRPLGGDRPPIFFLQGLRCKFEEKKLHLSPVAPIGRPGYIFEIFQNPTYIFEILIFFKYKKEKTALTHMIGICAAISPCLSGFPLPAEKIVILRLQTLGFAIIELQTSTLLK